MFDNANNRAVGDVLAPFYVPERSVISQEGKSVFCLGAKGVNICF